MARRTALVKDAAPKVTVGGSVAAVATYIGTNGLPTPPPHAADAAAKVGAWKGMAVSATADPLLLVGLVVVFAAFGWIAYDKWRGE